MRILVVDDEPISRLTLVHMLNEVGYTDCFEATNGQAALKLVEQINPDLVLLDVVMPDMDGYQVASRLKAMAKDIYLPIIFITALEEEASLVRCLEEGGDDFACKPFNKMILVAKIRAHARIRLLSQQTHAQNQELTYYRNAVEREHAIVEHIFANALTIDESVKPYFDYRLAPASNFNGDFFAAQPGPTEGMYFLIGDFTGHGLAAAVGALPVTRAFKAMVNKGFSVAEMASTLNDILSSLLPADMFFAAVIAHIDGNGTHVTLWNGAMPDLLLLDQQGHIRKQFESQHMALGILPGAEFDNRVERFDAQWGDRLICYSDGLVEMVNADRQMLGEQAFFQWLRAEPAIKVSALDKKIECFRGDAAQADDVTLVSFTCQDLSALRTDIPASQCPFAVAVTLAPEDMRRADVVSDLVNMLASQSGMNGIRADVFTVLSELYNNALDHGLLNLGSILKQTTQGFFDYFEERNKRLQALTSGWISIHMSYQPDAATITLQVKDSGSGFDCNDLKNNSESLCFGRGLSLVNAICSSLCFTDSGRCASAVINL